MAKTNFQARDIPRLVALRDYHYQTTIVNAIQKGFAQGCDYVTALALFKVGLSTGVIERNPRDPDEYRILSPSTQKEQ